jgi:signal transduction histidine kinase
VILPELLAYVQFDDGDRSRLAALHVKLAPQFPAIAERFYDAVFANAEAASVLTSTAQVERLRGTLIDWMSSGLLGPHDAAWNEKRSRIGRRHVQIGLAQQFMFTAMNVMRAAYLDRIAELYPPAEAIIVVRSVDKLFDIELALMLRHYQLNSEEKLVARERAILSDKISALQTMSAGLAHEVRNPLNAAKLQLELLERRLRRQASDTQLLEPAELARHEIERLTTLLNEFLSFARTAEIHPRDTDVVAILQHVIELERPLAQKSGAELVLDTTRDTVVAKVDPARLHQVVQNLVRNALEASPKGHVAVAISASGGTLHIRVSDDGPGIPEHVRARIFEPFFSTKEAGTGMGMAIVHNFVTLHGGTIDIATGTRGTLIDVAIPGADSRSGPASSHRPKS